MRRMRRGAGDEAQAAGGAGGAGRAAEYVVGQVAESLGPRAALAAPLARLFGPAPTAPVLVAAARVSRAGPGGA